MRLTDSSLEPAHDRLAHYFAFVQHRLDIFWSRADAPRQLLPESAPVALTSTHERDPLVASTIASHRFTNVYRITDRVSQSLVSNVLYNQAPEYQYRNIEDYTLNVILFKLFNRMDVWHEIMQPLAPITLENFVEHKKHISQQLAKRLLSKRQIWNSAYIMPPIPKYRGEYKHDSWLDCIQAELIDAKGINNIVTATSLEQLYGRLLETSGIGSFLAMQLATDLNYGPAQFFDLDENTFVKAGPGAQRGIQACFPNAHKSQYESAIVYVRDHFDELASHYGYQPQLLGDRLPTLMDLQNCFCETDKLLRVCMPDLRSGNSRIKQIYSTAKKIVEPIDYYFPDKWNLNYVRH